MKSPGRIIPVLAAVSLLFAASCNRAEVIPPSQLSQIYAELFLADVWLTDHPTYRHSADTSDYYGAIFDRYGYDFEDFDASVNRYLKKPEKFALILEKTNTILRDRKSRLEKRQESLTKLQSQISYLKKNAPEFVDFQRDTLIRPSLDSTMFTSCVPYIQGKQEEEIKVNVKRRNGFRAHPIQETGEFAGDQPLTYEGEDL